ncbi:MAG: hypothetical protein M0019_03490 [Actinomycetota bacterium]|nr:hypothetical protein [Actinomycetota bacterium]
MTHGLVLERLGTLCYLAVPALDGIGRFTALSGNICNGTNYWVGIAAQLNALAYNGFSLRFVVGVHLYSLFSPYGFKVTGMSDNSLESEG